MSSGDRLARPAAVLQSLVAPLTLDRFLGDVWEQRHLHVTRERNAGLARLFADLIRVDDVDYFLATICGAGAQRVDSIRLSRNGTPIPPSEYLLDRRAGFATFDANRILSLYRNGATLVVNSIQQTLVPVAALCADLSSFFGVRVLANVYLTPAGGQGFPAHHDNHDVFLLQILGEKSWNIHGAPEPLSRWASPTGPADLPADPVDRLDLRAGELLYLPRGVIHEGRASAGPSLHVTVGVHPYTWAQLLIDAISELQKEDVAFRRSVAPQLAQAGPEAQLRETVTALLDAIASGTRLSRVAAQHAAAAAEGCRIPVRGRLRRLVEPPEVLDSTPVRVPLGEQIAVMTDGDEVRLVTDDKVLSLPAFATPQVDALVAGTARSAADLPAGLDRESRLVLVRRLVSEGVLEALEPSET